MTAPLNPLGAAYGSDALAFINAVEFAVSFFACMVLGHYIYQKTQSGLDFLGRMRKAFNPQFHGGAYDFVIALFVSLLGRMIRTETAWEWRTFHTDLRVWQLALGVTISSLGILCLIRIVSSQRLFNVTWPICFFAALAFGFWSI